MKCLILAGGFATRLYPLTINKAKALLEYKGKPIISHIVHGIPANIDILVSTNKKFETDFYDWQKNLEREVYSIYCYPLNMKKMCKYVNV